MNPRNALIGIVALLLLIPVGLNLICVPNRNARYEKDFPQRRESESFVIWSAMTEAETARLSAAGERFLADFDERWGPVTGLAPLPGRVTVFVARDHEHMDAFYSAERGEETGSLAHNAGYYDPNRREIAMYGSTAADCVPTLVHELTHMLHHPWHVPAWVAEGFAQTVEYEVTGAPATAGRGCWDEVTMGSGDPLSSPVFDLGPVIGPRSGPDGSFRTAGNEVAYRRALALFAYLDNAPDERIRLRFRALLRAASLPQRQLDSLPLALGLTHVEIQEGFRTFWTAARQRAIGEGR